MLEPTTPQHGFLAVQLVVSVYVVAVSAALLVPFWPVFRRLHPTRSE